ncbi:GntR family transcriptional regulator [Microbacterium paludicola]|uniref:GntR family transcriptional regulator n=1 Tax=Microbacterium paludicola TaxID=300019 RepID=A0A4Y9FT29_9MICO|nr:GntR family transcriptional regulator [Microbacterium paludicola]MBF0816940.1 GntR family transcriptional regulator [Microbacterium paludicola]TFU32384.1 GntR family transcriptional regulator [Microbacterium paludicola]
MSTRQTTPIPDENGPALAIYRQFKGLIVSGQLGAGERLPTVRQTARDLSVAQGTAARAYKLLEREGLVVTRTAAGTRVADSVAVLPRTVVQQVRSLVEASRAADVGLDQLLDVTRAVWQTNATGAAESAIDPMGAA